MAFTAADVKKLREMTSVGMMDCKKALTEADGDFDKAIELLREKGLAKAAKKADRIAAEGLVKATVCDECGVGAIIEVNSETDFVAKNADFQQFVSDVANVVIKDAPADVEALKACEATLAKEKEILLIQALEENKTAAKPKPEQIIHKMVDGRIGKYYEENCLLQQAFVKENKVSVENHIKAVAKELGGEIKLVKCVRFEKGEGIEKKVDDFAAEVASMAK